MEKGASIARGIETRDMNERKKRKKDGNHGYERMEKEIKKDYCEKKDEKEDVRARKRKNGRKRESNIEKEDEWTRKKEKE